MSHYSLAVFTQFRPTKSQFHSTLAPYEEIRNNPLSKWDWWRVGGRWLGQLVIKPGVQDAIIGEPGVFKNEADAGTVDGARIGDLDQSAMLERRRGELGRHWDDALAFVREHGKHHPFMPDTGKVSRGDYVARATPFTPFAYIQDGQWYENGEMGFLGAVRNQKPENDWEQQFAGALDEQPDNYWITVLDCHI